MAIFMVYVFYYNFFLTNQNFILGTSLVAQWLRLHTPNAGGPGSNPGQGTRSHMLQLEDPACRNKDPVCYN